MISLRTAVPADFMAIAGVLRQAFARDEEADLVASLRAEGAVLLELVAEEDAAVIGHILYSELALDPPAHGVRAAALAPLAVEPAHQRRGIGGALIRMSLPMLAHAGADAVVVLGEPIYYSRFGFSSELASTLEPRFAPGPHLMALELSPGCLDGLRARLRYAAAFHLEP